MGNVMKLSGKLIKFVLPLPFWQMQILRNLSNNIWMKTSWG